MTNNISSTTQLYGLIGNPVEHSFSPYIHNYLFQCYSLNCVYLSFEVNGGKLKDAIDGVRTLGVAGLNITAPFKEEALRYVDNISQDNEGLEAINTIKNIDGALFGYNTDLWGMVKAFEYENVTLKGKKALILGCGAVTQTICIGLKQLGIEEITILNRTSKKAEILAKKLEKRRILSKCGELNNNVVNAEIDNADIIINTTSIDLLKHYSIDFERISNRDLVFFDIIYSPNQTELLKAAKKHGFKAINGLGMLAFQGIKSFEIWTGISPTQEEITKIFSLLNEKYK